MGEIEKFRSIVVEVEAVQLAQTNYEQVKDFIGESYLRKQYHALDYLQKHDPIGLIIKTREGNMLAKTGDYIIKGVSGDFYPLDSDKFKMNYEKV